MGEVSSEKARERVCVSDIFFPLGVVGDRLLSRLAGLTTLDNVPELLNVNR